MISQEARLALAESIAKGQVDPKEVAILKYRCQTDLFFLGRDVLGKNLTERTHQKLCSAFVQKDPRKTLQDQDVIKERLILYPRTSYKSTLDGIDCVQWMLCFPNIRIAILTGKEDLASAFVEEITNYFILEQEDFCLLHALFPEYCISSKMKREGYFLSPARTKYYKDPTLVAQSIESNTSGWHVDVMKCDDIITDENAENPERLKRITKKYNLIRKLVMSYGYRDTIGTRYELDDTYGIVLQRAGIEELYGEHVKNGLKYLSIPAWWLKGDTSYKTPSLDIMPEEGSVDLLFPEGIPYSFLCKELNDDKGTFASQFLNDPVGASDVTFRHEDLVARTIPYTAIPKLVKRYIVWDLAYTKQNKKIGKRADWTVGAVCEIDESQRVYVVDIIRGRFKPHELPYVIVKAIKDWKPERVGMEDMLGAQWLLPELQRIADQMEVNLNIEWFTIGGKKNALVDQVKALELYLTEGKLFFAQNIAQLDALYREFERYTGEQSSHDDIPMAISYIQKFVVRESMDVIQARRKMYQDLVEKDQWDRMYGLGAYAPQNAFVQPCDPVTGLPC